MKKNCKDIQQKQIKKQLVFFRVVLKYINTDNATKCACKSVLPFVDLGSLISVLQYLKIIERKDERLKEHLTFQLRSIERNFDYYCIESNRI